MYQQRRSINAYVMTISRYFLGMVTLVLAAGVASTTGSATGTVVDCKREK